MSIVYKHVFLLEMPWMFSLALVASPVDRLLSFIFTNKSKKYANKN